MLKKTNETTEQNIQTFLDFETAKDLTIETETEIEDEVEDEESSLEDFECEEESKRSIMSQGYSHWSASGETFYPTYSTIPNLPQGSYVVRYDNNNNFYLVKREINALDLLVFKDDITLSIINEVSTFLKSESIYNDLKYPYKRGIMLYGNTGTGKSYIVDLLSVLISEQYNGIILYLDNNEIIFDFNKVIAAIRGIEGNRKIMVVFDNFDIICSDKGMYMAILDILDGKVHQDGLLFVGTTCFSEKIEDSILTRPGRFSKWFEIKNVIEENRKHFIEEKFDASIIKEQTIEKIVLDTEGFSIDWLKELSISTGIFGIKYEDALTQIKTNILNKPSLNTSNGKKIGPQFK